jgi:hypothetical protein
VRAFVCAAALILFASNAGAQNAERPRYWVDFEAGRVEVDGDLNRLELTKNVKIRVDRYRLTSEHLVLERSPRGVLVDGSGRLAFCPCDSAPVTLGFRRAIVAPPTDLFVEQPTVYVGGVPVFWSPVLWLRSPDRLGMLPPRLAWRGEDGFLAGTGVHIPIGGKRGPTLETLDLFASGYVKGGIDTEATLATEHTTTRVRFDHLRESLLAVDSRGSSIGRSGAGVAWHVDAIRGVRGRRGTLALEPASRRYDRARGALGGAFGNLVASVGPSALAPRGDAVDESFVVGPELFLGSGFALGGGSSLDLVAHATSLKEPGGVNESRAFERSELDAGLHLGALRAGVNVSRGSAAVGTELGSSVATWGGVRTTISLPFARAFGDERDPFLHVVSPVLEGGVRGGVTRLESEAPLEDVGAIDDTQVLALSGIDNSLGNWGARSGLRLGLRGGFAGPKDEPLPIGSGKLLLDSRYFGARVDGGVQVDDLERLATSGRVRLGRVDTVHLSVFGEGRREREPVLSRLLASDSWDVSSAGWYDRKGFSAGSELGIAWTRWLATSGGVERDLTHEEWLQMSGALGYRHACGCLALYSWLGHRLGREGIDVQVSVDLMP